MMSKEIQANAKQTNSKSFLTLDTKTGVGVELVTHTRISERLLGPLVPHPPVAWSATVVTYLE